MKVKVTYTLNIEDVPSLIASMAKECTDKLERASKLKFDINRFEKTISEVSALQNELDLISSQLDDCVNMAHGYLSALNPPEQVETEEVKNDGEG